MILTTLKTCLNPPLRLKNKKLYKPEFFWSDKVSALYVMHKPRRTIYIFTALMKFGLKTPLF